VQLLQRAIGRVARHFKRRDLSLDCFRVHLHLLDDPLSDVCRALHLVELDLRCPPLLLCLLPLLLRHGEFREAVVEVEFRLLRLALHRGEFFEGFLEVLLGFFG